MTTLSEDLARVLQGIQSVTEMELHQVATGETLPGYRQKRRDAEIAAWLMLRTHSQEIAGLSAENERLKELVNNFKTWGIIEIAVRNPNVADYCCHWEKRAEAAESELAACRRDAERYKWLRDNHRSGPPDMGRLEWYLPRHRGGFASLDQSIDAAIDAQGRIDKLGVG